MDGLQEYHVYRLRLCHARISDSFTTKVVYLIARTDEIKLRSVWLLGEGKNISSNNIVKCLSSTQIQCYMATGGIPYYISCFRKAKVWSRIWIGFSSLQPNSA